MGGGGEKAAAATQFVNSVNSQAQKRNTNVVLPQVGEMPYLKEKIYFFFVWSKK